MYKIFTMVFFVLLTTRCPAQELHQKTNNAKSSAPSPSASHYLQKSAHRSWSGYGVTFEYANPEEAFIDGERATVVEREATARVYQVGDKTVIYYMPEKKAYYKHGTTLVGYLK